MHGLRPKVPVSPAAKRGPDVPLLRSWLPLAPPLLVRACQVESRKKAVMDRHLDLMLGQTERFSKMLAANLAAAGARQPAVIACGCTVLV